MPNQKNNHCGNKKCSPIDFPLVAMRCKLAPHMVYLDYQITPHHLQTFPCLLPVSSDFKWWSNMFISSQRHELLPLCVLASLNLFLSSIFLWWTTCISLTCCGYDVMTVSCILFCILTHVCITEVLPKKVGVIQHFSWEYIPKFPEVSWGLILPDRVNLSLQKLKIHVIFNNYI